jgi:hypothetical protein
MLAHEAKFRTMAHRIGMRAFYSFAITAVFVFSLLPGHASAQALGPGDLFPYFSHANNLDTPECDYPGIDPATSFHLGSHQASCMKALTVARQSSNKMQPLPTHVA